MSSDSISQQAFHHHIPTFQDPFGKMMVGGVNIVNESMYRNQQYNQGGFIDRRKRPREHSDVVDLLERNRQ
ncbi:hypothetical protein HK096_009081 [Nowakowskiella sp. JEL0078]|nr:hypothetical protein HK096_009081 [Nowakowskiella sp. JEL0078]